MTKVELLAKTMQKKNELECEHYIRFYNIAAECLEKIYEQMNAVSQKGKTGLMFHMDGEWSHEHIHWGTYEEDNRCTVYLPNLSEHDVKRLYGILKYDLIQNGYCVSDWYHPYPNIDKNVIRFHISWDAEYVENTELSFYGKIYNFIAKRF